MRSTVEFPSWTSLTVQRQKQPPALCSVLKLCSAGVEAELKVSGSDDKKKIFYFTALEVWIHRLKR